MWKVDDLRRLIDTNCPIIFAGSWDRLSQEGWRWQTNLCLVHGNHNINVIRDRVKIHGPMNVTIGHFFDKDLMKPRPETAWAGLYVRDLDIKIEEWRKALEDDEAIARWLDTSGNS